MPRTTQQVHCVHGTPVLTTRTVRAVEAAAAAAPLMARAGLAAAGLARDLCRNGGAVLVLAGPGNNGGDALVVARHLRQWWFDVTLVWAGDEQRLPADATAALRAWREGGGAVRRELPAPRAWDLVVDGIFGIGLTRDVAGPYADWIAAANATSAPILALDMPSGIDSDTGTVRGCAVRAAHTVTFIALKPGLLTSDGPDHCGEVHLRELDLGTATRACAGGRLLGSEILRMTVAPRALNTHKGDYGSVGIIGGDRGMAGAVLLAARAALRLGAGRVYAGLLTPDAPALDPCQPEIMVRTADEVLKLTHLTCLATGPGLGTLPDAAFYLAWALESPLPLVLDADALNLIAMDAALARQAAARAGPTLMTPHPAEAARLLGTATADVQADRVRAARELAARFGCIVALKGTGTICASAAGDWHVNTTGNPGMASAGMGDVLTGMVAACLAQGAAPRDALLAAVHLHGAAADALVARGIGPLGLTAGELIDEARAMQNRAIYAGTVVNHISTREGGSSR